MQQQPLTANGECRSLLGEAIEVTGAVAGMVGLLSEQEELTLVAASGYPEALQAALLRQPRRNMFLEEAIRRRAPVVVDSRVRAKREFPGMRLSAEALGDGTAVALPLAVGGKLIGAMALSFDQVRAFTAAELRFMQSTARQCAYVIELAQLYEAERAARAEAEQARQRFDAIIDQMAAGVVVVDREGRIVVFNRQIPAIYGVTPPPNASIIGSGALFSRPDGRTYTDAELPVMRSLAGAIVTDEDMVVTVPRGRRHLRVNATPLRDEGGAVVGAVAIFFDVTERRRAEDTLRDREERYRLVARATSDVIWDYDVETGQGQFNDALYRVFGYTQAEVGRPLEDGWAWWLAHVHPDDRARAEAGLRGALEGGAEGWSAQYRFRRGDGSWADVEDRCLFARDERGRVRRIVGALNDVSADRRAQAEREALLAELRQAVRVRDDFLSIAGHELRTPLTALAAEVLGLQRIAYDEAQRAVRLEAVARQTRRLTALTNQLLDVSRIVAGRVELQREPFDLAALAREVVARHAPDARRAGVALSIDAPQPVAGHWDRQRLEQVITNLVSNAIRYGARRPVEVHVDSDERQARLVVTDHGIGIAPEDQERIFQRFERAVSDRKYGGLGLGLWISRCNIDAHGGRIRVDSRVGEGSTFVVELGRR